MTVTTITNRLIQILKKTSNKAPSHRSFSVIESESLHTRALGASAEEMAEMYLKSIGYQILDRNRHYRWGEIDILASDKKSIILVEVKSKRGVSHGEALEMITLQKQRVLCRLARMVEREYNKPVRIDVITIDQFASESEQLKHYPSLVEDTYGF